MPKCFALITGPEGLALVGELEPRALATLMASMELMEEPAQKAALESAGFHHPPDGQAIVIEVFRGKHTLFVSDDARQSIPVELEEGDRVLFLDHRPQREPVAGSSGHSSTAGPNGATLHRWTCKADTVNLAALGWEPVVTA